MKGNKKSNRNLNKTYTGGTDNSTNAGTTKSLKSHDLNSTTHVSGLGGTSRHNDILNYSQNYNYNLTGKSLNQGTI